MTKKALHYSLIIVWVSLCSNVAAQHFTNPLLPSGADPWVIYDNGYYYYTHTRGNGVYLWKTKNLSDLKNAPVKQVWKAPAKGANSKHIWAPELHRLNDIWYIYYTATDVDNDGDHNRYVFVLENESDDPLTGDWKEKGKVNTHFSGLDGSLFEFKGETYFVYSAYVGKQSNLIIAKMINPWTLSDKQVEIARPTFEWEMKGGREILEGPQFLEGKNNKIFIIYSASACWADEYSLGMLTANGNADLLNPASWTKSTSPVFKMAPENNVYASGHNSFFKSPDGTEDWILYHANEGAGQGCDQRRSPRAQKFTWKEDGTPDFGEPVRVGTEISVPSTDRYQNPVYAADFADPTVIRGHDGLFYAFATNTSVDGKFCNIQVSSSADLISWKHLGDALPQKPTWADKDFWAPHVLYDASNQTYYMYYSGESVDEKTGKCLGVATAKNPAGPFVDQGKPLACGKEFVNIDPMAFDDPATGKKYLYWGSGFEPIRVQELNADRLSFKKGSKAKNLIHPEKGSAYSKLVEGAWVHFRDGYYYLYYSGDNCCGEQANYAVMVARSKSATGPFEIMSDDGRNVTPIVMKNDRWTAPGHNAILTDDAGQDWIFYHAIIADKSKNGRIMSMDKIQYKNGWPYIDTNSPSVTVNNRPFVKTDQK